MENEDQSVVALSVRIYNTEDDRVTRVLGQNYTPDRITFNGAEYAKVGAFPLVTAEPLTPEQWAALHEAEVKVYHGTAHGWTDTMNNDGDPFVWVLWQQIETQLSMCDADWDKTIPSGKNARVARRLARVLALINFGPESLLV